MTRHLDLLGPQADFSVPNADRGTRQTPDGITSRTCIPGIRNCSLSQGVEEIIARVGLGVRVHELGGLTQNLNNRTCTPAQVEILNLMTCTSSTI